MPDKSEMETLFPDGKPFVFCGKTYSVREFVLENRTQFLKIIVSMFEKIAHEHPEIDPQTVKVSDALIVMLDSAGEKLKEIYALVLGEDVTTLEKTLTLRKELELLESVLEVNDIPFLVETARRMFQKFQKTAA